MNHHIQVTYTLLSSTIKLSYYTVAAYHHSDSSITASQKKNQKKNTYMTLCD